MKYFKLIRSGIEVAPLLEEVQSQPEAWLVDTGRQERIRAQRETNTIFLRGAVPRPDLRLNENQESRLTAASKSFPKALAFMAEFAEEMGCQLSRATIVRLKPRSQVFRHIDEGSYYFLRDRFHLVLKSSAGSVLMSGGEQVRMQEGELWWFDNKQHHESYNESDEWRIHYIFDLLSNDYSDLAVNPVLVPGGEPKGRPAPSSARDLVAAAIRDRAILNGEKQRLISEKGNRNNWMIDTRRLFMEPATLDAAAELFWQEYSGRMPFQAGGMEIAGIPLLSAILMKSHGRGTPVNGFIVRDERKTHGTGSSIEGTLTADPIVMVDDILNSGRSMEKARVVLEKENRTIASAFVLIDYGSPTGKTWREQHGISVNAPFRIGDFGLSMERPQPKPMAVFQNRWRFASPDPNFFHRVPKSFPATDGKRVYFGSDCGIFWCLDAGTGAPVWSFKVDSPGHKNLWSSPAIHRGRVYFGSYDGNVYCLDAETGAEQWRFIGADWVGSSPALAPELGLLFIGLEFATEGKRGSIAALRLEDGEKVWEHMTKRYTHASPAYWPERQLVACGSNDNEMFLFDAPTGKLIWRFETIEELAGATEPGAVGQVRVPPRSEGRPGPVPASAANGAKGSIRHAPAFDTKRAHLVTGCANGRIYIIDVETGCEVWSVQTGNTIYTVPLVLEDKAYIGSTDKYLYILDLEARAVKTKILAGAKVFGPPRLLEGRIYFGACNGMVYEIDPLTDQVTGTHQLPDAVTNALTYNSETKEFYALTYMNELFAFSRARSA